MGVRNLQFAVSSAVRREGKCCEEKGVPGQLIPPFPLQPYKTGEILQNYPFRLPDKKTRLIMHFSVYWFPYNMHRFCLCQEGEELILF